MEWAFGVSGDEEYPAQKKLIYQGSPHGGRKGENHMNKVELSKTIAKKLEITIKDAEAVTTEVFDTIVETLAKGEEVSIAKFGKFRTEHKDATTKRNPQTGEAVAIEAKNVPKFKFSSVVKEAVK